MKASPWFPPTLAAFGNAAAATAFLLVSVFAAQAQTASSVGVDRSAIDPSVNPCQNFYQYACGGWLKANPIPPDESTWGRFDVLQRQNQQILRGILEDAAAHPKRSPDDRKVGQFYQSCMNEDAIENLAASPLNPELDRIAAIATRADLLAEIVRLHDLQVQVFFNFTSAPDPADARREIADFDQGGLGLPERDFYFRSDASSQEIRQKYLAHIEKMLELSGVDTASAVKQAAEILRVETALAKVSLDVTSRRDPHALYHLTRLAQFEAAAPAIDFKTYLQELHAPLFTALNVSVPAFLAGLNDLLAAEPLANLKSYLAWHYINASANLLSRPFVQEDFEFYGRALTGASELQPRWKRCVTASGDALGEALGKLFVKKTNAELGKARTLQMVREIEEQMRRDLLSTAWMSAGTKQRALEKLALVANKIGYPERWRDYSSVRVESGDYFDNWYRANQFESRREIAKIGKPVDKSEWQMTPPTVNAYYDPAQNNINFPAGILQPPFFSKDAAEAVNYGAIGAIIGHELTHGFDDEGRQYDGSGNLKDWWTRADKDRFAKRSSCFVREYEEFHPAPDLTVNGNLTLGENTADNGGIRLAYLALLENLARKSLSLAEGKDGFTPPQQFFLGFAQAWCENQRPEAMRLQLQTDPHAPAQFRVNGTLSNMPEFDRAFSCKPPDAMAVTRACRVW